MILPDNILETTITLKDQYFDLKGLSSYSSLCVSTLRDYIKKGNLPAFGVKGKILIKRSEYDLWMEKKFRLKKEDIGRIANEALRSLKKAKSKK